MILSALLSAALAGPCDSYAALAVVSPAAPGGEPSEAPCVSWNLDLAGQLEGTRPVQGLSQQLRLSRGRVELGMRGAEWASGRVALEPVRSGGATGYTGIDGESLVPRFQIAEARLDWSRVGLAVAMGLVDDPWVIEGQQAWGLPGVALPMATDQGWMERADLGGWLAWTAPRELATLSLVSLSGEGYTRRERNDGQDVGAMLRLRPLALAGMPPELLVVSGFARSGSRGIEYAQNHRAGLRITSTDPRVAGGVELLAAWGVDSDGSRTPGGASAWVRTGDALPALAWARVDLVSHERGDPDTRATSLILGAGPSLSAGGLPGQVHLVLGYRLDHYAEDAAAFAGAGEASDTHTLFLQLGARLRGLSPLMSSETP
ncbi:MAG: hypothetical protein H6741_22410 [Alphaproteobacteria bacterium]|nr:hypothetical protein [Alphaproteobacteria bacterium]